MYPCVLNIPVAQIFTSLSDIWFMNFKKHFKTHARVRLWRHQESPWLLHTKRLPQNKMWSSEWQTVNNQTSNTFRTASATDFLPCFLSITTVITLVCACVAWSVLCLWLMHLEQLLRVLSSMPRYFCNRWCRPVCRRYVMAGSSIANAGPSDRSRPLQRPTCEGGVVGSFKDQVRGTSLIFRGLKGWGVRPERRSDYMLVIVTHSCRSYLPITSIASQILGTSKGRFPPITTQGDRIHHNGRKLIKKKRRTDALSSCTSGSIKVLACLQRYRCYKPRFYSLNLREGSTINKMGLA